MFKENEVPLCVLLQMLTAENGPKRESSWGAKRPGR
jgi:hypothetical protein